MLLINELKKGANFNYLTHIHNLVKYIVRRIDRSGHNSFDISFSNHYLEDNTIYVDFIYTKENLPIKVFDRLIELLEKDGLTVVREINTASYRGILRISW